MGHILLIWLKALLIEVNLEDVIFSSRFTGIPKHYFVGRTPLTQNINLKYFLKFDINISVIEQHIHMSTVL